MGGGATAAAHGAPAIGRRGMWWNVEGLGWLPHGSRSYLNSVSGKVEESDMGRLHELMDEEFLPTEENSSSYVVLSYKEL